MSHDSLPSKQSGAKQDAAEEINTDFIHAADAENVSDSHDVIPLEERAEEVASDIVLQAEGESVCDTPDAGNGKGSHLGSMDANLLAVEQSRASKEPHRERVKSIKRAIEGGRQNHVVNVYQNETGTLRYAPDGAALKAAYSELNVPMPVNFITVANPKKAAEIASCRANEGNGKDRSRADMQYQAAKAIPFLEEKHGRPPKARELMEFTLTSHKFCNNFLRAHYAQRKSRSEDYEVDSNVPDELEKIAKAIRAIKIPKDWFAGEITQEALKDVNKELARFRSHDGYEAEVTVEDLKTFMKKHSLSLKAMAKLVEVKPITVSRWLKEENKITTSNMRNLNRVLSLDEQAVAALLDEDDDDA